MVRLTTMSTSSALSSPSTVSARNLNSFARAFAASVLISAQARISMPRNSGASEKYAFEMLPQPMTPIPSFLAMRLLLVGLGGCDRAAGETLEIVGIVLFHDVVFGSAF